MRREATAMNVRQNLGELLNQVQYRGDSVVVTKHGKPVAALVEQLRRSRVERWLVDNKDAIAAYNALVHQHGAFADALRTF
jgi:prevent-host-death family protein